MFNIAHGHLVMFGAFLTWLISGGGAEPGAALIDLPLWAAVIAALLVSMGIGRLIERFALRPMTGQPLLAIMLMTLGLAQLFEGVTRDPFRRRTEEQLPGAVFAQRRADRPLSGRIRRCHPPEIHAGRHICCRRPGRNLFIWFFNRTKTGLAMRATAENHEVARSDGINVSRVFGLSWGIAGVIATLGGVLLATVSGVSLNLSTVALIAFPAILLGGLESLGGALLGGFAIGLVQALVQAARLIEVRNSTEIAPYLLLLVVLLIRPEGLFGQKRIERV